MPTWIEQKFLRDGELEYGNNYPSKGKHVSVCLIWFYENKSVITAKRQFRLKSST